MDSFFKFFFKDSRCFLGLILKGQLLLIAMVRAAKESAKKTYCYFFTEILSKNLAFFDVTCCFSVIVERISSAESYILCVLFVRRSLGICKKNSTKIDLFCSGFGFDEMSLMLDVKSVLCCVHAGRPHILLLQSLLNGSHKY